MVNRKTNPVAPATRESAAARAHAGTHGVAVVGVRMLSTWGSDGPCDRQIGLERGDPAP
ncbi:MAG TPA: hypothetical protein VKB65_03365 [Myxococcota bacterium]|nr:hypothetical protein [Myxococcota bacterium]